MTIFSKQDLRKLMEERADVCVSIYLPTHQGGAETQQDPIRLKNLLSQAASKLETSGLAPQASEAMLKPAWALLDQYNFWQHQDSGLALFLSPDHLYTYRLPLDFDEMVVVAPQFHIKPLIPMLVNDGQYYILAASQNQTRLFQATRYHIHRLELEEMPESLAEALRFDDPEKQLQFHSGNPNNGSPTYHGQGVGTTDNKTDILRFFQAIDRGVYPLLNDANIPLVFVGVDYLFPIYQIANNYNALLDKAVATNPDNLSSRDIHEQTLPLVKDYFEQAQVDAAGNYRDRINTRQTSSELLDILVAAHDGQIDTLFIPLGEQVWGKFNAEDRQLEIVECSTAENDDLLNLAAIYTLFCDGKVYAVPRERMPGQGQATAILRYPMPSLMATA